MASSVHGSFRRRAVLAVAALGCASAANAVILVYSNGLSGPAESPPNASPGFGVTTVTIDTDLNTMRVQATFSALLGTTTACHIHATTPSTFFGIAGVATQTPSFVGFPLGVTAGVFDNTYDMTLASSFNPTFVTNNGGTVDSARAVLFSAIDSGRAYLNIHSTSFPPGEIRGFLPTPGVTSLFGLAALAGLRRRRA